MPVRNSKLDVRTRTGSAPVLAQDASGSLGLGQPEAIGKERIVGGVADVDRDLRFGARPGVGQLGCGLVIAKEHIGDALALGAG